jgi:hypothetical protein
MRMADLTGPAALRVAATLRIADHIASGVRTGPALAAVAGADADALTRMLWHLVTMGVLTADADGRFALTKRGEALREDHPHGMRARLDIEGAVGRAELSFAELLVTVRTGRLAYAARYGCSFWEDIAARPELSDSFNSAMAFNLAKVAKAILSAYDWGRLSHVVDVGGGDGTLLIALLTAHPALRGTLVELPGPAKVATKAVAAAALADRAAVHTGSFFDPLPPGASGYLLSDVLHNWDDAHAVAILRRCGDAARAGGGSVFVIGEFGTDGNSPGTQMDMLMLAYFGGREHTISQLTQLGADAGLTVGQVHSAEDVSVIEFVPS